jgi:hypothetical protein
LATRRGPATEAQALYDDLDPPQGRPDPRWTDRTRRPAPDEEGASRQMDDLRDPDA